MFQALAALGSGASSSDEDALFDCVVCLRDVRTLSGVRENQMKGDRERRERGRVSTRVAHYGGLREQRDEHTGTAECAHTRANTRTISSLPLSTR
jgi:hypothetical protein